MCNTTETLTKCTKRGGIPESPGTVGVVETEGHVETAADTGGHTCVHPRGTGSIPGGQRVRQVHDLYPGVDDEASPQEHHRVALWSSHDKIWPSQGQISG